MQGRLVLVPPCSTASLCSCLGCSRVEISAPPVVALSLGGLEGGSVSAATLCPAEWGAAG